MTNAQLFLKRIGMDASTGIEFNKAFLDSVQYHAVTSIAYENLDLIDKKPLSLEPMDVFKKIVIDGRGGYCFELNGLLSWFFKELGFEVKDYFARFLRGEEQIPMRRHRIMSVKCENELYICDIGVGQIAPRHPLKLVENEVQTQFGESYKFTKDENLGWILWDLHNDEWRKYISFTEETQYEIDFVPTSYYCEASPYSNLNKTAIIAIKTHDGRKTINDGDYKVFKGDELMYIEENISDERFCKLLKSEFNINIAREYCEGRIWKE